MARSTHYQVPSERGRLRAVALAVFVHLALLAMLWIGVRWQNETPVAVEAEIWDSEMREAAPEPTVEKSAPKTPAPEPEPTPRPAPKAPEPEVAKKEMPAVDPDIALQQKKKRKELEKQREAERQTAQKRETEKQEADKRAEEQKRREAENRETEKQEATRKKQQAAEEERRQQEQAQGKAAKEKAEKEKAAKEKAEREKAEKEKAAKEKIAKEKAAKEQAAKKAEADRRHAENLERLQAQAGTGGIGEAAKSQGGRADSDYSRRVGAKIKSNTIFNVPPDLTNNPAVEYVIDLLPDGSVRGIRKQRSSGMPGFDEAVSRAIERSQPFPPDKNGQVPSSLILSHEPKDQ